MRIDLWKSTGSAGDEDLAPIAWYEGLQLLPQHFQILDARQEALMRRAMLASHPFAWGVDRLMIDHAALSSGVLRVLSVAGQFPDGFTFSWTDADELRLEQEIVLEGEEGVGLFVLALPREDFTDNGARVQRHRQFVGKPVADRTNPDERAAIARWTPNFSLRKWRATDTHYAQLPLVKVARTASGFQLAEFHPPSVRLLAESACAREVAGLIRLLREKARRLEVASVAAPLTKDHRNGLMPVLHVLVAGLPRLEAQLSSGVAHPYDILLTLCDIAGMVASLAGQVPDLFPAYSHREPSVSILGVVRYIARIANAIGVDRSEWTRLPFQLESGRWTCNSPPGETQEEILLQIVFNASLTDVTIASWLDHTLICWDTEEARCREFRIRGMSRRQHASLAELGLPPAPMQRYVEVQCGTRRAAGAQTLVVTGVADERVSAAVESVNWLIRS